MSHQANAIQNHNENHFTPTRMVIITIARVFMDIEKLEPLWTSRAAQGKASTANAGDTRDGGSIPGFGRSPGVGNSSPLHYSGLENPMDRGAWLTVVHGVAKSWTRRNTHAVILTEHVIHLLVRL